MIKVKKILVVGDVMLDRYWMGSVNRTSPEAPVPIVDISSSIDKPGGAANVAKNLSDFGMNVTLSGICGKDEAGRKVNKLIKDQKIKTKIIEDIKTKTTVKLRVISKNQQLMRIDHEDSSHLKISKKLLDKIKTNIKSYDAVIISDYDKGVVKPIIRNILKLCKKFNIKTFIDPKGNDFSYYQNAYLLKPNQKEFEEIVGESRSLSLFKTKGEALRKKLGLTYLLVTRGKDGMMLFEKNKIKTYPAMLHDVFDVTGAGDTVISILAAYAINDNNIYASVDAANIAAGISVQKLGSTSVTQKDLSNVTKK